MARADPRFARNDPEALSGATSASSQEGQRSWRTAPNHRCHAVIPKRDRKPPLTRVRSPGARTGPDENRRATALIVADVQRGESRVNAARAFSWAWPDIPLLTQTWLEYREVSCTSLLPRSSSQSVPSIL